MKRTFIFRLVVPCVALLCSIKVSAQCTSFINENYDTVLHKVEFLIEPTAGECKLDTQGSFTAAYNDSITVMIFKNAANKVTSVYFKGSAGAVNAIMNSRIMPQIKDCIKVQSSTVFITDKMKVVCADISFSGGPKMISIEKL